MKSFLSFYLIVSAMSLSAQHFQDLYPTSIAQPTFNKAGEQAFQAHLRQCEALWKRLSDGIEIEDLSKEEQELHPNCSEAMPGYWSVEGAGCSWYCGGGPYEISASSTLASPNNDRYAANNAHDLNFKTAWVEGASGLGIGESLTYHFMPQSPRITEIRMADGSQQAIEKLSIGDQIMSVNQASQNEEVATILELAAPIHCQLVSLRFSDGRALLCTADHPLVGVDSDWLSYDPAKTQRDYAIDYVKQLGVGSQVMTENGPATLKAIKLIHEAQQTYTIVKLDRNQMFFANGMLVGVEALRESQEVSSK